jgi:hypothetical protein
MFLHRHQVAASDEWSADALVGSNWSARRGSRRQGQGRKRAIPTNVARVPSDATDGLPPGAALGHEAQLTGTRPLQGAQGWRRRRRAQRRCECSEARRRSAAGRKRIASDPRRKTQDASPANLRRPRPAANDAPCAPGRGARNGESGRQMARAGCVGSVRWSHRLLLCGRRTCYRRRNGLGLRRPGGKLL